MKNKTIDDEKSIKCEKQIKIKTHRLPGRAAFVASD